MMIYHNSRFISSLSSATISRRVALHRSKKHGYCVSSSFHRSNKRGYATLSKTTDTLIIGGGPIGLSTAYNLASNHCNNDGSSITVIERDPTYASASATLSAGGIRQQFSLKENVQMSLYGRDFLREAHTLLKVDDEDVDVQFQESGYLFLAASPDGKQQMIQNHTVQTSVGCNDILLLDHSQLATKFPWLNVSDILLGSFGAKGEGWFDPWALIRGLKRKCKSMNVQFVTGYPSGSVRESSGRLLAVDVLEENQSGTTRYNVNHVVNAAGSNCSKVMETLTGSNGLGLVHPIPVEPRKRCIFFIHCNTKQEDYTVPAVAPLIVCPLTGVYFRSEGQMSSDGAPTGNFLCGVSPSQDVDRAIEDENELDYADHKLWDDIIWPALYHRAPMFGDVKVISSWAGCYEYNTLDQNAIIDFHPEMSNVLMVNGFSGHGLQQSPAAGKGAAELLSYGKYETLDLSIFSFDRCCDDVRPVFEAGIV